MSSDLLPRLRPVRTYEPAERPEVLVQVENEWHPGQLRQWSLDPSGGWWASVSWRQPLGATSVDMFPSQHVWEDREETHPGT